jgi:hypothetical protein
MSFDIFDSYPKKPFLEPQGVQDRAEALQNGLIMEATGGTFDGGDEFYKKLRREFLANSRLTPYIPPLVKTNRDLAQYWQFIKQKFPSYAERRSFIYGEFQPLLDKIESTVEVAPHQNETAILFESFTPGDISEIWKKAIDRTESDPAGAITLARTLLESVCKYILDEENIAYESDTDLPKLWALCAEQLNLSPSQHNEKTFKAILGNCQSIVNYLGTLRNRLSDSHGQGKRPIKPKRRHAELAVNLSGSMTSFLVSTWQAKKIL